MRAAVVNSGESWPNRRITVNLLPGDAAQARQRASTWRSRAALLGGAGELPLARAGGRRWSSASWASTARCARSAGCCRWCAAAARAGVTRVDRAAGQRPRGGGGRRACTVRGRRLAAPAGGVRPRRGRAARPARRPAAARRARPRPGRRRRPGPRPAGDRGRRRRRAPRGAVRAAGRGQDHAGRAAAVDPARARRRGGAGGHRAALDRRRAARRRRRWCAGRRSRRRTTRASVAALVGGGSGLARPGRALAGPPRRAVPGRGARVRRTRRSRRCASRWRAAGCCWPARGGTTEYPARVQLVLAANPCPCANRPATRAASARRWPAAATSAGSPGRCSTGSTSRSSCMPLGAAELMSTAGAGESSAAVAERVAKARAAAAARWSADGWRLNAEVPGPAAAPAAVAAAAAATPRALRAPRSTRLAVGPRLRPGAAAGLDHRRPRRPRPARRRRTSTRPGQLRTGEAHERRRQRWLTRHRLARVALTWLAEPGNPRGLRAGRGGRRAGRARPAAGAATSPEATCGRPCARWRAGDPRRLAEAALRRAERARRAGVVVPGRRDWPARLDGAGDARRSPGAGGRIDRTPLRRCACGCAAPGRWARRWTARWRSSALAGGDAVRRARGHRHRLRAGGAGVDGGVRRRLRHRRGRAPGRAGRRRADGRGAGVRRRPAVPGRATPRCSSGSPSRPADQRVAAGRRAAAAPVPDPQPGHRGRDPRHGGRRGGRPQRRRADA